MFILSYCVCRCCRLTCHYFLPAYNPLPPRISPPIDKPIKTALQTRISPGLIGREIRYTEHALVNLKFQHDVGNFTLNFTCNFNSHASILKIHRKNWHYLLKRRIKTETSDRNFQHQVETQNRCFIIYRMTAAKIVSYVVILYK